MDKDQYLEEVRKALEKDQKRLGDVWRLTKEDKSPADMSEELGLETNISSVYRKFIQIIEMGEEGISVLPTSRTTAIECRDSLRGFIKRGHEYLSQETIQILEKQAEECERRANDPQALEQEYVKVERETSQAESQADLSGVAGIYVYTYPHYYRYPVIKGDDETDDRTYLKIGMSARDASERVRQQTTPMPEPPMLLQIWIVENDNDLKEIEKKIHDHLRTIGHGNFQNRRQGNREWFLTNEQSVASTANLLGLKLHYERGPEADD